jgi:transcriptional antiterminator RfaH
MHVEASSTQSGLVWVNGSSGSNNQVNDDKVHHAQVKWYLLTTKPRSEQRASDNLEAQGYEAFFPQFKNTRLRSGKRVQKVEALFPGYLFVKVELTSAQTNFNALRSTRGVGNFVCFGSDPSVVSEQLIAHLKQNLTQSIEVAQKTNTASLNNGDPVVIRQGPFAGLQAIYECQDGLKRSILLLSLLHKKSKLSLANTQFEKQSA